MKSQTKGIQQLRGAEKLAEDKVSDARKRKDKRLKDAGEEAQESIEKIRQERDRQFKEFEAKHMGSHDDVEAKMDAEMQVKIEEIQHDIEDQREQLIEDILALVYDIVPKVHQNLKYKREISE